jgi:hypothetical protein
MFLIKLVLSSFYLCSINVKGIRLIIKTGFGIGEGRI